MTHAENSEELIPHVKVHSEISPDLDYDHEAALETLLKDCTDEQLISEIARRKLDLQHKVTSELVAKYYHFEKLLGHGASGKVYLVYHRESGEKFACKVIKKDGSMNDAQSMTTEIEIMKRIRHRYIVSLYELFESAQCMWLILELVEGTGGLPPTACGRANLPTCATGTVCTVNADPVATMAGVGVCLPG